MTLGANCSALLPLCRSDYQPINRAPNCLGSDAGNYLYTLMERIFQKGTPTPLSSYILCTLPCSSFYYTCPKEKREKKNRIHFFTVLFSVLFILPSGLPLLGIEGICLRRSLRCPRPQAPVSKVLCLYGPGPLMPGQAPCHLMNRDIGKEIPLHSGGEADPPKKK